MSDISVSAPPPPPPPPPRPAQSASFDFVQPFTFIFQDERWVTKVLIGGLFYLACFLIIGIFFLMGYCARLARNVIANVPNPLPEWDDLGAYFSEGLRLFCVALVYIIPIILIVIAIMIPAGILTAITEGHGNHDFAGLAGGTMMTCGWCLLAPLYLIVLFWLPAALLFAIVDNSFGGAFEFKRIFAFIKANFVNYLLAFIVQLVAGHAAGFGAILFCIGIVFTGFWSMAASAHAFAQVYRLSPRK
jgi:hypothetical protein